MTSAGVNAECGETVMIDSVTYTIPDHWCGRALDSAALADPEELVVLPDDCTFQDYRIFLTREARDAYIEMAFVAREDGIDLIADSGYRSAEYQRRIFRRRMAAGESFSSAARFVAPPGYSSHQTGCSVDLVPSEARFAHTPQYAWLRANAHRFGFGESYPEDSSSVLSWESWHWSFVQPIADTTE
ncbi:MAG: D-alanyl-D-alanine carboxypeptidase family protein [Candidatus Zixiibacteriota bacterium]